MKIYDSEFTWGYKHMHEFSDTKIDRKRYFESAYDWKKIRPYNFSNFYEARQEAEKAAKDGVKNVFSSQWADEYVNNFRPETTFWRYENMIRIYADSLLHKTSEQEADMKIKEIEHDWQESDRVSKILDRDIEVIVKLDELELAGYQDIAIPCPVCKEGAIHNVDLLPEDPQCYFIVRYRCDKCDYGISTNRISSASDDSTGCVCDECTTHACDCLTTDSQDF